MAKQAEKSDDATEGAAKGGRKLVVMAVVVLVVLAAVYLILLKPKSAAAGAEPPPEPGIVVQLDPVTMNLADGHFLKVSMALQATAAVSEELNGAKALDIAIHLMSNRDPAEFTSGKARDKIKAELLKEVEEAYEGEVMDIYFTELVMQ